MKRYLICVLYFSLSITLLFMSACTDDEIGEDSPKFPPIYRGEIEANRFLLTFTEKNDTSNKQTVEFYDPDGVGGVDPIVQEKLQFKKPIASFFEYNSEIKIYNDSTDVTHQIVAKQTFYIICYKDFDRDNLRGGNWNEDINDIQLGTKGKWSTLDKLGNSGTGNIRVTLNFQPEGKDGLCDPGIRILEGSVPYQIN